MDSGLSGIIMEINSRGNSGARNSLTGRVMDMPVIARGSTRRPVRSLT